MVTTPRTHLIKAFAVHDGKYYPLTPRRDLERNGLLYLGRAEALAAAVDPDWHASALELLNTFAPNRDDHVDKPGETSPAAGGQSLRNPWYVVFEYGPAPGDLWVGRFWAEGTTTTTASGVFVFEDTAAPMELDLEDRPELRNRPLLNSRRAARSVVFAGQSAAGGNTRGSNHGGEGGENDVRLQW